MAALIFGAISANGSAVLAFLAVALLVIVYLFLIDGHPRVMLIRLPCLLAIILMLFGAGITVGSLLRGEGFGEWREVWYWIERGASLVARGALLARPWDFALVVIVGWLILRAIKRRISSRNGGEGLDAEWEGVTALTDKGVVQVNNVNLTVSGGTMAAVLGPVGAGKSTLIKVLLGERRHNVSGRVRLAPSGGSGRPHRNKIGYVPQSGSDDLYPDLTVFETLRYAAGVRPSRDKQRIEQVISSMHLESKRHDRVSTLSGGQRRRLSIGVELVGRPQLLVLDEPTTGMDLSSAHDITQDLLKISRSLPSCTVIITTHLTDHLDQVDQVAILDGGGQLYRGRHPTTSQGWTDLLRTLRQVERQERAKPLGSVRTNLRRSWWASLSPQGFWTALRRQRLVVCRRGFWSLSFLLVMPVVGTFLAIAASPAGLQPDESTKSAHQVLAILITVAALTGSSLTYSDLVHDRDVLHRDHRVGASACSLLAAKTIVFGGICLITAGSMTAVFAASRELQPKAYGLPPAVLLLMVIFSVMISSLALGVFISAVARTLEQAVTLNTLLALFQVLLNGSLFPLTWSPYHLNVHPLEWTSLLLPARLGFAAVASASKLSSPTHDALWKYDFDQFLMRLGGMGAIFAAAIVLAILTTEMHWRGHIRRQGR